MVNDWANVCSFGTLKKGTYEITFNQTGAISYAVQSDIAYCAGSTTNNIPITRVFTVNTPASVNLSLYTSSNINVNVEVVLQQIP